MKTTFDMNLTQCAFQALPAAVLVFLVQQKHNNNVLLWDLLAAITLWVLIAFTQWWQIRSNARHWEMAPAQFPAASMLASRTYRFVILNLGTLMSLHTLGILIFFPF